MWQILYFNQKKESVKLISIIFTDLLKSPQNINPESSNYLTSIINEYPYFQAARTIYLKSLKNNESFKYNSELKKTAAYTTDRTVLFDFITSDVFIKKS